ncbi:hypothetical protein [Dyella tabacisoli]|uniref:Uncharacterized protein n=1 Tax=Dyella tabacisoli TaxID=2282381 RepID=A0A369UTN2_9GAMM|nr:hypothetical protein DVJ77_05500 [Dyella tabacisoli]
MQQAVAGTTHRARLLRALGVTPWVRRHVATEQPAAAVVSAMTVSPGDCVVLLPAGGSPRSLDLLGRALCAYGPSLARAARIEVAEGRLATVPEARAYLVFGQSQAHALGRELSAEVLNRAHIVLADEPAEVLTTAAGKRRLWSALRSLRRALAVTGS